MVLIIWRTFISENCVVVKDTSQSLADTSPLIIPEGFTKTSSNGGWVILVAVFLCDCKCLRYLQTLLHIKEAWFFSVFRFFLNGPPHMNAIISMAKAIFLSVDPFSLWWPL